MVRALILALVLAGAAAGADLKPGEQLPWCRLTLNQAATIDRDAPDLKTFDGWYDATTYLLISTADDKSPFAPLPLDPARIVNVQAAKVSKPMPSSVVAAVNQVRQKHPAKDKDKP